MCFRDFGLYEDDYTFVGYTVGMQWKDLVGAVRTDLVTLPQGRPIGFALPKAIAFLGSSLGGLPVVYIFGFCIVVTNVILFYRLLRRRFPEKLALFGGLALCLFPADTTRPLLTHCFQLQLSLMFLLVASHLYLSKRKVSYLVILGSLLSYESAFLPFFALPLMERGWGKKTARSLIRHVAILVGILACLFLFRKLVQESRVGRLTLLDGANVIGGMCLGPIVSAFSFVYGPLVTLKWLGEAHGGMLFVAVGSMLAFVILFAFAFGSRVSLPSTRSRWTFGCRSSLANVSGSVETEQEWLDASRGLVVGVVMMVLAYAFAFTHFPPFILRGRATSVHFAAALGSALAFGSLCYGCDRLCSRGRLRWLSTLVLALYFATLVGYGVRIQSDFRASWKDQRWFFARVLEQCPDLSDGTLILVETNELPEHTYIYSYSWATPIVLEQIFQFPESWETPPRLFMVDENWTRSINVKDATIEWWMPAALWEAHWARLPEGNLILLKVENGRLTRCFDPVRIREREFALKQIPAGPPARFEKGHLYDLLIQGQ